MAVKTLHQIPCTLSRSAWDITINGDIVRDWVMANLWWHCSETGRSGGHVQVQICVPLKYTEDGLLLAKLMAKQDGNTIRLIHQEGKGPLQGKSGRLSGITVHDAEATLYELLPMTMGGTQIEGIDARSDTPVVQAITFSATLKRGELPLKPAGSEDR